jgi:alpha-tubulin suppressor-like RCC1 family protein/uncharacterized protein YjdB
MIRAAVVLALLTVAACDSTRSVSPEPVASVSISGPATELHVGEKIQLAAKPVNATGGAITGRNAVWSSTNESVATVSSTGEITGVASGVALITAVVGEASGTISLRVLAPRVASIFVSAPQLQVAAGARLQLTAVARDAAGAAVASPQLTWTVSDPLLAQVAQDGTIIGQRTGSVVVTAEADGVSGSATVAVTPGPAATIALNGPAVVYTGERTQLTVTVRDALGNLIPNAPLSWSSSDAASISVDAAGTLTGVRDAEGVSIIAQSGSATLGIAASSIRFVSIGSGDYTTCGLSSAGNVYCWGVGAQGQLGVAPAIADTVNVPVRATTSAKFVKLEVGDSHACALTSDGTAYCWGANEAGQVGIGTAAGALNPQPVLANVKFKAIAPGRAHTCALALDGGLYCWGNVQSMPPRRMPTDLQFKSLASGQGVTCGLTEDGTAWCFSASWDLFPNLPAQGPLVVPGEFKFSALMISRATRCGIEKSDSRIYCWASGNFSWGLSNIGATPSRISQLQVKTISGGLFHICAISLDDRAYCRGTGTTGQIGDGQIHSSSTADFVPVSPGISNVTRFTMISAGDQMTAAIADSGAPYNWGRGGLLGSDTKANIFSPLVAAPPRQ